jgi:hypothetical protein
MFTEYHDITERIAEPPRWWDENRVPRYCEFSPYTIANIYAREAVLLDVICSMCGQHFMAAMSHGGVAGQPERAVFAEEIRGGKLDELDYGDPPNFGNCRSGPSTGCYELRVLQYWSRMLPAKGWTRDKELEIELPTVKDVPDWLRWTLKA